MDSFPTLTSPLTVGGVRLRNRVVVTAHVTNFGDEHRHATDRYTAYLRERARGGAGLIVTESLAVHPTAGANTFSLQLWDDSAVTPLRRVADAVRAEGAAVVAQLNHGGREHASLHTRRPLVSASAIPSPRRQETPHALAVEEIDELVSAFAAAATRAAAAGLHGVEVHAGHGYLIQQFLSPWSNTRRDAYGGDEAGRMRLLVEVLRAVRAAVPRPALLGLRISADEFAPGGLGPADMARISARVHALELLDYLSASQGSYARPETLIPDSTFGRAPFTHLTRTVRNAVPGLPVVGVGSIVTPEDAERALTDGDADLVGMTRAHIADPYLVRKLRHGRRAEIRQCLLCNQGCVDRLMAGVDISCLQNPAVGREDQWPEDPVPPAPAPRRVVVVGGGPAGMEAAWVAAARGHQVTLLEAGEKLGGTVNGFRDTPGRREFAAVVDFRARMLARHRVDVRTGVHADATAVLALQPDQVILASGADPAPHGPWPDTVPATRAVAEPGSATGHVAVHDGDGQGHAAVVAEILRGRGHPVTLVTSAATVDRMLLALDPDPEPPAATGADGLHVLTASVVEDWRDGHLMVRDGAGYLHRFAADTLVTTGHLVARDTLAGQLRGQVAGVRLVGDAAAPRHAYAAVADGHRAAREI